MNIVAIIQARMGSSRLPGKVMMPLAGEPVIRHVTRRAGMIRGVAGVVVATSVAPGDDELAAYCGSAGIQVFRGSEEDVLDRFCDAAEMVGADAVVRITADCPLLDPEQSAGVVEKLEKTGADYASNAHPPMLPDGLDTEAITVDALFRCRREAAKKSEREHVTLFIHNNPGLFRIARVTYGEDLSCYRWTLDEESDYRVLSLIFEELAKRRQFGYLAEVLQVCRDRPGLLEINTGITRNEGLAKSLTRDGKAW